MDLAKLNAWVDDALGHGLESTKVDPVSILLKSCKLTLGGLTHRNMGMRSMLGDSGIKPSAVSVFWSVRCQVGLKPIEPAMKHVNQVLGSLETRKGSSDEEECFALAADSGPCLSNFQNHEGAKPVSQVELLLVVDEEKAEFSVGASSLEGEEQTIVSIDQVEHGKGANKDAQRDIPTQNSPLKPLNYHPKPSKVVTTREEIIDAPNTYCADVSPWFFIATPQEVSPLSLVPTHAEKMSPLDQMGNRVEPVRADEHEDNLSIGECGMKGALRRVKEALMLIPMQKVKRVSSSLPQKLKDMLREHPTHSTDHFEEELNPKRNYAHLTAPLDLGSKNERADLKACVLNRGLMFNNIKRVKPPYPTPHFHYYMLVELMNNLTHLGGTAFIHELNIGYGIGLLDSNLRAGQINTAGLFKGGLLKECEKRPNKERVQPQTVDKSSWGTVMVHKEMGMGITASVLSNHCSNLPNPQEQETSQGRTMLVQKLSQMERHRAELRDGTPELIPFTILIYDPGGNSKTPSIEVVFRLLQRLNLLKLQGDAPTRVGDYLSSINKGNSKMSLRFCANSEYGDGFQEGEDAAGALGLTLDTQGIALNPTIGPKETTKDRQGKLHLEMRAWSSDLICCEQPIWEEGFIRLVSIKWDHTCCIRKVVLQDTNHSKECSSNYPRISRYSARKMPT